MKRRRRGIAAAAAALLGAYAVAAIVALPCSARAADPDPWFGRDKALHFGASTGLAMGGYAVGTAIVDSEGGALLIGAAVSVTAGVTKECLDLAGLGDPSWKDLTWDGIGTVTGLAVAWGIHQLIKRVSSKPAPIAPVAPVAATASPFVITF